MFKSSLIVMILNMVSRVLGLFREILIATYFGASGTTDAYFTATRVSNFFTTLLGEGALGSAFIPIYNDVKMSDGEQEAKNFTCNVLNMIISFSFWTSLLTILFSKQIIRDILGFKDPTRIELASNLLKIMGFYLLFISISGVISSILNNYGKFYISTLVGIIFNLTIIIGTFISKNTIGIYGLAISFLLSGLFQVLIQIPSFLKIIKEYKLIYNINDKNLRIFLLAMIPTLIGIFGYQINELVATRFAASLKIGTISAINYASRIYLLPIGIFAISLSVVVFPNLSKAASRNDLEYFKLYLERGLNLLATLIIPSSIGLLYYSKEIINLIFGYGKFSKESIIMTSEILQFYALGLLFFSSIHLLTRAHYAFKNRRIPVKSSFVGIFINILLDFLLYKKFTHKGITFATSFAALVNYTILFVSIKFNYVDISLKKYLKFILIAFINSLICLFIVERINISNSKMEIIVKLVLFVFIYFSLLSLKYLKDKKEIFDK